MAALSDSIGETLEKAWIPPARDSAFDRYLSDVE